MRVLLIEDDRMIGTAMQQALKDAAYAVDWVTDGETAIHAAENESYELALLDLGLPNRDGLSVLAALRRRDENLPAIIITARDGVPDGMAQQRGRLDGIECPFVGAPDGGARDGNDDGLAHKVLRWRWKGNASRLQMNHASRMS